MNVDELDYDHPESATAQRPAEQRDDARLMVVAADGAFTDAHVRDLPVHVRAGDVFVVNESRVRPARLRAAKATGGAVELLVTDRRGDGAWLALLRASHPPRAGEPVVLPDGSRLRMAGREAELFVLEEEEGADLAACLERHGAPPLPPYIRRASDAEDVDRYQTTYARRDDVRWGTASSSVAAPTAGLHLTAAVISRIEAAGGVVVRVSLGVGLGTFRPIAASRVEDHSMHDEPFEVTAATAEAVNAALSGGRRVTAVGTTTLRALEAAATPDGHVRALAGRTGLFLLPGSRFGVVTRLLTNFHRPRSTLLALLAGFAGTARALEAHRRGVTLGYRLFSYGDAMLVERAARVAPRTAVSS